jgi:hypothetical protein
MSSYAAPTGAFLPDLGAVDFGDAAQTKEYMQSLVQALTSALDQRTSTASAQPGQLLLSPNGSAYRLGVSDAGVATFTLIKGPKPPVPP